MTLTDVAARAGVSQPTASRVLNGSTRTPAADIVHRVRVAAAELGYIPNAQAQALARATSGLIGLLVPDIADPYFSTIAGAVQQAALRHGRQMMLAVTDRQPDLESQGVEAFVTRRADAIIIVGSRPAATAPDDDEQDQSSTLLARYTARNGRVIVIGPLRTDANAHTIVPDSRGGAAALVDTLVTKVGIKAFILLSGPPNLAGAAERTSGSIDGLRAHGIHPRAVLHHEFTRQGGYLSARQAITELNVAQGDPTCLIAGNDVMAIGAMTALRQTGLRIPDDVAVTGFDDIPMAQDVQPSLTTVRLPMSDMGRAAVDLALTTQLPQTFHIPGQVVLRGSTG